MVYLADPSSNKIVCFSCNGKKFLHIKKTHIYGALRCIKTHTLCDSFSLLISFLLTVVVHGVSM